MDYYDQDFKLWMRERYTNYINIFILFFCLGYIFDFIFLSISLFTIVILFFLKKIKIHRYIINQPLFLWIAIFTPYIIMFDTTNHYDLLFPFSWIFASDFGYRGYGISQILQNQMEQKTFITIFLLMYIAQNLELKYYNKWKQYDYITPRFKKIYNCIELSKKPITYKDVLHNLVYQGNIEKISKFLNAEIKDVSKVRIKNQELDKKDKYGRPLIHLARTSEMVDFLLSRGVDVDQVNSYNNQTLLHLASQRGNLKLAEFLLKKGAYINKKDIMKRTPIDYANSIEMRVFLISKGGEDTVLYNKIKYYFTSKKYLPYISR